MIFFFFSEFLPILPILLITTKNKKDAQAAGHDVEQVAQALMADEVGELGWGKPKWFHRWANEHKGARETVGTCTV